MIRAVNISKMSTRPNATVSCKSIFHKYDTMDPIGTKVNIIAIAKFLRRGNADCAKVIIGNFIIKVIILMLI